MDKFCFIMASSDDRIHVLDKCVECIKNNKYYYNADVFLYFQGNKNALNNKDFFKDIVYCDRLRGIFTPRYELFKMCSDYDFVIIIDDDLFLYPDTSYDGCMQFLNFNKLAGCVNIGTHRRRRQNKLVCVSDTMDYYNVDGGLVLPKRAIQVILDYFSDKEADYTEDMFWLLLYVKGYDLWRDCNSNAIHNFNVKGKNKEVTGYTKMRYEKPYKPILTEWFDNPEITTDGGRFQPVVGIKTLKHINAKGMAERMRNRKMIEGR